MKPSNKKIFNLFKEYRWMKELIEEKEALSAQYIDDPFLSKLNQGVNEDLTDLKNKVAYIDEKLKQVEDDKAYWMLNLLRQGHTVSEIVKLMKISSNTFYKKCDTAITSFLSD